MKTFLSFACAFLMVLTGMTQANAESTSVLRVIDGDTIVVTGGIQVRLVQIDAPELRSQECYSEAAKQVLTRLIGKYNVRLVRESNSANSDVYGRLLRYVYIGKRNLNIELVSLGAASPWFFNGELGKFSDRLLSEAKRAKSASRGLWKKCPGVVLNPYSALSSGSQTAKQQISGSNKCDINYYGCIPPFPPDLNCSDLKKMGLIPVKVKETDVHKLDRDGDGIGCDK